MTKVSVRFCLLVVIAAASCSLADAGDWPTWRHDAQRSGASPDALPSELHLQWVRQLPSPRPAWPASQFKLQFDAGYEPVVSGQTLIVGSTVNDSIAAFDTRSGAELWRYYTDGPVRFAPAVWENRVYAVSDDGCLYCLDPTDGALKWKVRGGPTDRKIIGNGRLISTWPVRGGVVVDDGTAYFAAGIWPSMGVFIHAVNASTGKVLWTNSDTSSLFITHPHGADAFGSISPQGHLALTGDALIVPGGRTLPAVFDRRTGELRHFSFGGKGSGGHRVMAAGGLLLCGNEVLRLQDGDSLAQVPASVVGDRGIIGNTQARQIAITSIEGRIEDVTTTDRRGREQTRPVFFPAQQDRITLAGPGRVHAQVGNHLITSGEGGIAAYDLRQIERGGDVAPTWTADVGSDVWTALFADDRLFVVTTNARIVCFGSQPTEGVNLRPKNEAAKVVGNGNAWVDELVRLSDTDAGYAVILGLESPETVPSLLQESQFEIIAVDDDQALVDRLRRSLDAAGRYGVRAAVHFGDPFDFGFPPYLASLVVSTQQREYSQAKLRTVFEMLRPYGGTAALKTTAEQHESTARRISESGLETAEVSRQGEWTLVRRAGPLPGAGVWTHQYGDSSQSGISHDSRVKAPFGVLWFGGPSNDNVLPRHGHGPTPQVAGGRLFIEGPDMLRCVDVYTGRVWWERELTGLGAYYNNTGHHPGAGEIGSNYVSLPDAVYVVYGDELLGLDATTGETIKSFQLDGSESTRWGFLAVHEDLLVATAAPVVMEGIDRSKKAEIPQGSQALIEPHSEWKYLAGRDPDAEWTSVEFDAGDWKVGAAGFGYGDGDDKTVLADMEDRYARVYVRREFDGAAAADAQSMTLTINYDDAFIAYLNGREVVRKNVSKGQGAEAKGVDSHEADGYATFPIEDFKRLLKPGLNVLSVEGHNRGVGSSDFTLDPYLVIRPATPADATADSKSTKSGSVEDVLNPARYASASRQLVVFDRHTGEQLWTREAAYSYRHNCICLADGKVFCIDGMSPTQLSLLRRRGIDPDVSPTLSAFDARTGEIVWTTTEDVFGTFLNYSAEHDVLLQAGSAYRDRADDEVDTGLAAYRGKDGRPLWKSLDRKHGGPCLLWKDRIITNGSGGFALDLLTGEPDGWEYLRMYGCNTAIGSEHLLTFRSGAAGFCDLASDSGSGNLSGFRSSCTSNLIVADGVLNAPDYTRTCACAYQLQTSIAFVHMPEAESWTFNRPEALVRPIESLAINLGAPGDRRDEDGLLWLEYPIVGGPSPELTVETEPSQPEWFRRHSSLIPGGESRWVAASGASNLQSLTIKLSAGRSLQPYLVTLVFAEPEPIKPGDRVFSVTIQDEEVLSDFDVVLEAGAPNRPVVKRFLAVAVGDELRITLKPASRDAGRQPVLCGVSLVPSSTAPAD